MRKILCPTDFSDLADKGIAYAAKVTQQMGATLTLINVQSLQERTPVEAVMGEEFNRVRATNWLEEQSEQVRHSFKISCDPLVQSTVGPAIKVIAENASAFDLVVMSSGGPSDLAQYLTGSHTYRLIRSVATPVLMVPRASEYSEIRKVAFAYDYLKNGNIPLEQVMDFCTSTRSELLVLQVVKQPYTREVEVRLEEVQKITQEKWQAHPIQFKSIYADEVANSLYEFTVNNGIDVLALGTEDHGFLEGIFRKSTIKAMTVLADYPTLVTHR